MLEPLSRDFCTPLSDDQPSTAEIAASVGLVRPEGMEMRPDLVLRVASTRTTSGEEHDHIFPTCTSQAVLDLETALVSSSPFTVDSTSSLHRGDIIRGNGPSSWLRGFIGWLPSSPYASAVAESGSQAGLWNGTAELFASAVNVFVAESGNTR